MDADIDFGRNFIKARKSRGIDQKDAAAAFGISPAFLSKVENNKNKPSIELILKAADYYNVDPGFFFYKKEKVNLAQLESEKNKRFINDLENLSDKELKEKYQIDIDGKQLSDSEIKGIMAYVRSLRSLGDH